MTVVWSSIEHFVTRRSQLLIFMICMCLLVGTAAHATITHKAFGMADKERVELYTLKNANGLEVQIMTYGASIVSLKTPDRNGHFDNIVLGFDTLDKYLAGVPYYGATVGRYANRIAHGRFAVDGTAFQLALNDGPNSLHGGTRGFDKRVWKASPLRGQGREGLRLVYVSAAGEEGYPGQLTAEVTYRLSSTDQLEIDYHASTTAPTVVNLANHAYFNLTGDPTKDILNHILRIDADKFTPVDSTLIPTGEMRSVEGSPFDFRIATPIGARIEKNDDQLRLGHGYDHNWILKSSPRTSLRIAAILSDPVNGRVMTLYTTQPGLQFYSGNFLDGKASGKGTVYKFRSGLCLETQHFPDSPNQPSFPNTFLKPGETYAERTVLKFSTLEPFSTPALSPAASRH